MSARRILSATGDIALELLQLTAKSTQVFPPLQSVAELALLIAELVRNFRSHKDEWRDLGRYIRDATASVTQSLAQIGVSHADTKENLEELKGTLDDIAECIKSEQALSSFSRIRRSLRNMDIIVDMRDRIDQAIGLFQLSTTVLIRKDLGSTFEAVIANGETLAKLTETVEGIANQTTDVSRKASQLGLKATLDKLPRIHGAAWNPLRACMDNTRVELIKTILTWVSNPTKSGGAEIMLLTGVAGAGKTSVAHTIARECQQKGQLGSSFFFDRETAGRNGPDAVFTTIAADLSRLDSDLAANIAEAIESNTSLAMPQQFEELVLKPSRRCHMPSPVVLVIDALDEAWDSDFVRVLQARFSMLPNSFRMFLTSRMRPDLTPLLRKPHVIGVELDINTQSNMEDITVYVQSKLRELVGGRDDLETDWPGEKLRAEFTAKAGGLFLWVATVCDHLRNRDNPTQELEHLVSTTSRLSGSSARDKMNRLYARILEEFDWSDASFVSSYRRVMGTALAAKTPLTIAAMKQLYHDHRLASDFTLHRLSPLLTGMRKADHRTQPVRVLHQSLRDFLIVGISDWSSPVHPFKIVKKEHSQELAVLCLELLNRDLGDTTPGTGYIAKGEEEEPGVPALRKNAIPEALRYACMFLQDHLYDLESPKSINEALREFMTKRVVHWIELLPVCGRYRGTSIIRWWAQRIGGSDNRQIQQQSQTYAETMRSLSGRLHYDARRTEALVSIEEAVQLYRELAEDRPAEFTPDLASSLQILSHRLSHLGLHEGALAAIEEAVQLRRQLAIDQPATFIPDFALSLNNLSLRLSSLRRYEEALVSAREAVQLYQQLVKDQSAAFAPNLGSSLDNLSVRLSQMGRREEALATIEEAVQLYRQLVEDQPAAFTPDLALSLKKLSARLSESGRREEALVAIGEAVQLRRQLVEDQPTAFTPDLALSLNKLSARLSESGRREDALVVIKEAVQLYRRLVKDRPAAFTPDLAVSLNSLSFRLSDLGRREEALAAIEEVVVIRRQLAAQYPLAFRSLLKGSLNNLSRQVASMGRDAEARAIAYEARNLSR